MNQRPTNRAGMTPEEMDRVVDQHFEAEERADLDAILNTVTDGIERTLPGTTDLLVGKEATRAFYDALYADMRFTGVRHLRRWYGPDHLVDLSVVDARAIGRPFGFEGRGRTFEFSLFHIFEFSDGLISFESGWADVAAAGAQLATG
jgi:hypothetical protein